ncbi:hypothetical protein KA005_78325 [bacterium]|nr:hypothetical protein [bacterium]
MVDNILISSELLTAEAASEDEMGTVLELHTDFVDTVNQLKEQFQSALAPSTDNLIGGIENAFAAFVESLQNLLVPIMEEDSTIDEVGPESESAGGDGEGPIVSEQESLVVETPAADGPQLPIPTGSTYQDLIDEMGSAFTGAIAELTVALNTAQVIPEVSGPNGNGKAYDKFLAIYHNL